MEWLKQKYTNRSRIFTKERPFFTRARKGRENPETFPEVVNSAPPAERIVQASRPRPFSSASTPGIRPRKAV